MRKFYSLTITYVILVVLGTTTAKKSEAQTLTLQSSYNLSQILFGGGYVGVAYINSEYWISKWNNDSLFRLTSNASVIQKFTIPKLTGVRSMTYDGNFIYAGLGTYTIAKIDPATQTYVDSFKTPVISRFVTYSAAANNGAGGLWIGTASLDFYLIDFKGNITQQILHEDHNLAAVYGLAYDSTSDGTARLWAFDQTQQLNKANMARVPISTGIPDYTYNVQKDFPETPSGFAGGAFVSNNIIPGQKAIACVLQGAPAMLGIYTISSATLPVTIKAFSGEKKASVNSLKWTTATEQNCKGFELQSSVDGNQFKTIVFVASKAINGNSVADINYSYDDKSTLNGNNYYRLAQIDKDGKTTFSSTITIKASEIIKAEFINVYPNPVTAALNVSLNSLTDNKVTLIVTDVKGSMLLKQVVQANTGNNNWSLKVQSLAAGTYILKAIGNNKQPLGETKFIKN